ncbi:MAG: MFS transporter [Caulobacteraceae bacterium]|nr:MFS transporter [Caulobacteraceae bacterium]
MAAVSTTSPSVEGDAGLDYPSRGYRVLVVAVMFLAYFMAFLHRQVILIMIPALKADLHVNDTLVSLLAGLGSVALFVVAGVPLGRLADRTSRRNLMWIAVALWSLAALVCGLVNNFWLLFVARMVVGLGEAALQPAAFSLLTDYFPPTQRGRAIALAQVGVPVGSSAAIFGGGLFMSLLASGAFAGLVPEGMRSWQALFIASALPGFVVAAMVAGLREPVRRGAGAAEVAAAPLWPFLRRHGLAFWTLALVYAGYAVTGYGVSLWTPTVLMRIHHFSPAQSGTVSGLILLLCSVPGYAGAGFLSDLLDRWRGPQGRAMAPLFLTPPLFAVLVWLALTNDLTSTMCALIASFFLFSLGSVTLLPALQAFLPNRLRGQGLAIVVLVGNVAGLGIAPTVIGAVNDYVFHDEMKLQVSVGLVNAAVAALIMLLAIGLPRFYAQACQEMQAEEQPG